jgi:hypothetical protein
MIKKKLLKLDEQEQVAGDDIEAISSEIAELEAKRNTRKLEQHALKKRRSDIFQGMSAEAAFRLGRQIEHEQTSKRARRR